MASKATSRRKKGASRSFSRVGQPQTVTADQRKHLGQTALVLVGLGAGAYLVGKAVSHALAGDTAGSLLLPASSSTTTSGGTTAAKKAATTSTGFPLTYGMKNNPLVRVMQQAILARGGQAGAEIRDSGGADGTFGPGTKRSLAALREYSTTSVNETAFKRVTQMATMPGSSTAGKGFFDDLFEISRNATPTVPTPITNVLPIATLSQAQVSTIQRNLKTYVDGGSASFYSYLIGALSQIRNAGDYQLVNENGEGLIWGFFSFTRTTLAEKLREKWSSDGGVTQQLLRMGLRRGSDNRWYLPTGALA